MTPRCRCTRTAIEEYREGVGAARGPSPASAGESRNRRLSLHAPGNVVRIDAVHAERVEKPPVLRRVRREAEHLQVAGVQRLDEGAPGGMQQEQVGFDDTGTDESGRAEQLGERSVAWQALGLTELGPLQPEAQLFVDQRHGETGGGLDLVLRQELQSADRENAVDVRRLALGEQ